MFQAFAPGIMPLTVEEGIADGVSRVRRLPGTRSSTGHVQSRCAHRAGSCRTQPAPSEYSDEELRTIADEAHRAGLKVAAHAHGDDGIRAAIE